jgi:hypothetical protein
VDAHDDGGGVMPRNRFGNFFAPVSLGATYRVTGYHTGEFIGEVEQIDRDVARLRVVDTLRRAPRVVDGCPFPACVLHDFHAGDHELTSLRVGAMIDVSWRMAKFREAIA